MKRRVPRKSGLSGIWHYRIFKVIDDKETYFCIKEFYPECGARIKGRSGDGWTLNPCSPFGETKKMLIQDLEMMLQDARKYPVKVEKVNSGKRVSN